MKVILRLLYQFHRWLGVALALFMLLWFLSGLVIMYSDNRTISRSEQLANAESLNRQNGLLSLDESWIRSAGQRTPLVSRTENADATVVEGHLVNLAGAPVWLAEDDKGSRYALSAEDGHLLEINAELAIDIASRWLTQSGRVSLDKTRYIDQAENAFVPRNYQALAPFHRIAVNDPAGTELLISSKTGEVVSENTRLARVMYLTGNWIHLLKPLDDLGLADIRKKVQLWLGLSATIASLTGLIIGWLRWRPGWRGHPTYSSGRKHPYRDIWNTWHFWSGLIGGTLALTWSFSGFIDTNPGQIFTPAELSRKDLLNYLGTETVPEKYQWQYGPIWHHEDRHDIVEVTWRRFQNEALIVTTTRDGRRSTYAINGEKPNFTASNLQAAVKRVVPGAEITEQVILNDYDSYYYPRHHQNTVDKPLPVLRVQLNDSAKTRFYIDPQDGKLLTKLDSSARLLRWFYSALHHWDFGWLYQRPVWDLWLLLGVGFGLVLSLTSVILGWKRIGMTFRFKKTKTRSTKSGDNSKLAT